MLLVAVTVLAWPESAAGEGVHLRVLTFNAYAVPFVSSDRAERAAAIAPAVAELAPNLVALQEVWTDEDASEIVRGLRSIGLRHARAFSSSLPIGWNCPGLVIAADRPLESVELVSFDAGAYGHTPWHVDWISRKGAVLATIATSVGPVVFGNAHLNASYLTGDYVPVRIAQALDLAEALRVRPHQAVILAGDLNAEIGEGTIELLRARARLFAAIPEGLDQVLHRSAEVALRVLTTRTVLDREVTLPSGVRTRLSDHAGLLVDYEVTRVLHGAGASVPTGEGERADAVSAGEPRRIVADGLTHARRATWIARALLFSTIAGAAFVLRARRRGARNRRTFALAVALLLGACYAAWFTFGYAPAHVRSLERALTLAQ